MNTWKRWISMALCLALCMGVLPVTARAADETDEIIDLDEARRLSDNLYAEWEDADTLYLLGTSNDYTLSDEGIQFLCSLEGFSSTCYKDGSQSSIGYGSKCTSSSTQPHEAGLHTITEPEARSLLVDLVSSRYAPNVRKQTADIEMNQSQFDALVSLCYNCGGGNDLIYNSPLVKYLRGIMTEEEARSAYSEYIVYFQGSKNQGLINRRNKEANLFFSDNNSDVLLLNESTDGFNPLWPIGDSWPSTKADVTKYSMMITAMYRYYNNGSPKNHGVRSDIHNAFDIGAAAGTKIFMRIGFVQPPTRYARQPQLLYVLLDI